MWFGPTARLLSDGLPTRAAPCGPLNPSPRPSKLSTSVTPAAVPGSVCSIAAAVGGTRGAAYGVGGGDLCGDEVAPAASTSAADAAPITCVTRPAARFISCEPLGLAV